MAKGVISTLYKELLSDWDVVATHFSVVRSLTAVYLSFPTNEPCSRSINLKGWS